MSLLHSKTSSHTKKLHARHFFAKPRPVAHMAMIPPGSCMWRCMGLKSQGLCGCYNGCYVETFQIISPHRLILWNCQVDTLYSGAPQVGSCPICMPNEQLVYGSISVGGFQWIEIKALHKCIIHTPVIRIQQPQFCTHSALSPLR